MEQDFLAALANVRAAGTDTERFISAEEIATLQQRLQRAMLECSERRDQIAPLVSALSAGISNQSDKP